MTPLKGVEVSRKVDRKTRDGTPETDGPLGKGSAPGFRAVKTPWLASAANGLQTGWGSPPAACSRTVCRQSTPSDRRGWDSAIRLRDM